MKCNESIDMMLDIIYGEEVEPHKAYGFFNHLKECGRCDGEFRELAETREMLGGWIKEGEASDPEEGLADLRPVRSFNWWGMVQKAAALVLMVFGAAAAGQAVGLIPEKQVELPEEQLIGMINDIVVERQSEGWMVIGRALVSLKEDMDARDRLQQEVFYEDLSEIEERFLRVMEESRPAAGEATGR